MREFENRLNKGGIRGMWDAKVIDKLQGCNIESRRLHSRFGI